MTTRRPAHLPRPANDVGRLLDRSIAAFAAEVPERPEDLAYLRQCGATLWARIDGALPQAKPYYTHGGRHDPSFGAIHPRLHFFALF